MCWRNAIVRVEDLRCLTKGVARVQCALVRFGDCLFSSELLRDPLLCSRHRALVEPEHHAEREEVLRQLDLLARKAEPFAGARHHCGHGNLIEVVALQRTVVQWVNGVARLLQVDVVEGIGVDDDAAARNQVANVHLQRGGVHRHQHIWSVAWRMDVARREADLETGDTWERACRRANLRRVIRKGGDVVTEEGGGGGELAAGQLHSVARVAGESDRDSVKLGDALGVVAALGARHAAQSSASVAKLEGLSASVVRRSVSLPHLGTSP